MAIYNIYYCRKRHMFSGRNLFPDLLQKRTDRTQVFRTFSISGPPQKRPDRTQVFRTFSISGPPKNSGTGPDRSYVFRKSSISEPPTISIFTIFYAILFFYFFKRSFFSRPNRTHLFQT